MIAEGYGVAWQDIGFPGSDLLAELILHRELAGEFGFRSPLPLESDLRDISPQSLQVLTRGPSPLDQRLLLGRVVFHASLRHLLGHLLGAGELRGLAGDEGRWDLESQAQRLRFVPEIGRPRLEGEQGSREEKKNDLTAHVSSRALALWQETVSL